MTNSSFFIIIMSQEPVSSGHIDYSPILIHSPLPPGVEIIVDDDDFADDYVFTQQDLADTPTLPSFELKQEEIKKNVKQWRTKIGHGHPISKALLTFGGFESKYRRDNGTIVQCPITPEQLCVRDYLVEFLEATTNSKIILAAGIEHYEDQSRRHVHVAIDHLNRKANWIADFRNQVFRDFRLTVNISLGKQGGSWKAMLAYVSKENLIFADTHTEKYQSRTSDMLEKILALPAPQRRPFILASHDMHCIKNAPLLLQTALELDFAGFTNKPLCDRVLAQSFEDATMVNLSDLHQIQVDMLVVLALLIKNFEILPQRELNAVFLSQPRCGKSIIGQMLRVVPCIRAASLLQSDGFPFNNVQEETDIILSDEFRVVSSTLAGLLEVMANAAVTINTKGGMRTLLQKRLSVFCSNHDIGYTDKGNLDPITTLALTDRFKFVHTIVTPAWENSLTISLANKCLIMHTLSYIETHQSLLIDRRATHPARLYQASAPTNIQFFNTLKTLVTIMPVITIQTFVGVTSL